MTATALAKLVEREKFLIIGHRGAAALQPENTLPGFSAAMALGCPMLELDVHRVADSDTELAVIHDESMERTTNDKRRVSDVTLSELAHIDAGNGARVPTLSEVINVIGEIDRQAWLNVELKGKATAEPTWRCLTRHGFNQVLISSFDHQELANYRVIDSTCAIAPLYHRWRKDVLATAEALDAAAVNLSSRIATRSRVQQLIGAGYLVFVYTVNSPETAAELADWGVHGVFTDDPGRVTTGRNWV